MVREVGQTKSVKNESGESEEKSLLSTVVIFGAYLVLFIAFFVLLNSKTGSGFGFIEIIAAIALAILISSFFIWIDSMMKKGPYLGVIIGIIGLVVLGYALSLRFEGPFTKTFMIIGSIIWIVFLVLPFLKYRKDKVPGDDVEQV